PHPCDRRQFASPKARYHLSTQPKQASIADHQRLKEVATQCMKFPRRRFLHLVAGAAALPAASHFAWAQTYPSRPERIIVGLAGGCTPDIVARLMAQSLSERLGQQFVVENRTGATGNIAAEAVVRAPPDGYTLLLVLTAYTINATLYEKLNFNFLTDITP